MDSEIDIEKHNFQKMELGESGSLTSGYAAKLQSLKERGTGTKPEMQINRTEERAQK